MPTARELSLPPNAAARDGLSLWLTLTPQIPIDKLSFGHSSSLSPLTLMTLMAIMVVTTVLCHPSHLRLRMFLKVPASPCSSLQCVSVL